MNHPPKTKVNSQVLLELDVVPSRSSTILDNGLSKT
jgi:hypothetical protein